MLADEKRYVIREHIMTDKRQTDNMKTTTADDTLYHRFRGGEAAGFDQLMIRYADSVIRYLYGYVHDLEEAEDLMIDAFARIYAKKPAIGEGAVKAYIFRVARNLALRSRQRSLRLQTFSIEGMEEMDGTKSGAAFQDPVTVESDLGTRQRNHILYQCLEQIDPDLREALWLVYVEGLSYAQTATVLGVKPKRVDRLLVRGKEIMRRELSRQGITNAYD